MKLAPGPDVQMEYNCVKVQFEPIRTQCVNVQLCNCAIVHCVNVRYRNAFLYHDETLWNMEWLAKAVVLLLVREL